jgi:hypothetical protein
MELNRHDNLLGATAQEAIAEGLFVIQCPDATGQSMSGLNGTYGARKPATPAEALRARWAAKWPQNNIPLPGPLAWPSLPNGFALRDGGFDQAQSNNPVSLSFYLTYPGVIDGSVAIPSGYNMILCGGDECVVTLTSGTFVANAGLVPGAMVEALNTADDGAGSAGKLSLTTDTTLAVADVVAYDASNFKLTVRVRAM